MPKRSSEEKILLCSGRLLTGSSPQAGLKDAVSQISRDVDWNYVFLRAGEEKVIPQVYASLSRLLEEGLESGIPEDEWIKLEHGHFKILSGNVVLSSQASLIRQRLDEMAIPILLLKGFAVKKFYSDESLRYMFDFDFMVKDEDGFRRAADALEELGFIDDETFTEESVFGVLSKKHFKKRVEGKYDVFVDLHDNVFWPGMPKTWRPWWQFPVKVCVDKNTLWARAEKNARDGSLSCSPEDYIVMLCAEALGKRERFVLRDVNDLHVLSGAREVDWAYVLGSVRSLALEPFLEALLKEYLRVYGPRPQVEDVLGKIRGGLSQRISVYSLKLKRVPIELAVIPAQLHYNFHYLRRVRGIWYSLFLTPQVILSQTTRCARKMLPLKGT